ncbi:MAG: sulfite exporter TauE/SafE family protein, partial [Rhodospirillales bacterium]
FVQTLNISFTFSSLVMAAGLAKLSLMGWGTIVLGVIGIGPVFLGVHLGGRLRRRLDDDSFRRLILMALVGLGLALLARPFLT